MKKVLLMFLLALGIFTFSFTQTASALDGEVYGGAYFDTDFAEYNAPSDFLTGISLSQDMNLMSLNLTPYVNLEATNNDGDFQDYKATAGLVYNVTESLYVDGSYERWNSFDGDTDAEDRMYLQVGYKFSL